jgi:hypothetical protein
VITLTSHTITVLRNLRLLTKLKFSWDVTSCQMTKQLYFLNTGFLRWTLLLASFAYMVFAFLVSFEPVYTLFCSMWWTVHPDGFWVQAMQMRLKVSLTSHLPTFPGANTVRLLSLSLLPQTHLPPPFQPPRSRVFQCFHYFKDRLALKKKASRFLLLLWKCQIL